MSLEELRRVLPDEVHFVLANCDSLTLHALHPERPPVPSKSFHGYLVLDSTEVEGAQDRRDVIIALYQGMADDGAMRALCFIPRHGVHAAVGSQFVDLVLCYQCGNIRIHLNGEPRYRSWSICGPSKWLLDDLLKVGGSA